MDWEIIQSIFLNSNHVKVSQIETGRWIILLVLKLTHFSESLFYQNIGLLKFIFKANVIVVYGGRMKNLIFVDLKPEEISLAEMGLVLKLTRKCTEWKFKGIPI